MSSMSSPAPVNRTIKCMEWWQERINTIEDFKDKVQLCHNEDDLKVLFAKAQKPWAGVFYENTVGLITGGAATGDSAQLSITLAFGFSAQPPAQDRPVPFITELLMRVRALGLRQRSPTGHLWRFVAEVPLGTSKDGVVIWAQRWTTPIILTPTNPC